jgi:hypothetical protein
MIKKKKGSKKMEIIVYFDGGRSVTRICGIAGFPKRENRA